MRAFDAAMTDPAFVAETETPQIDLGPISGEELPTMVREVTRLDAALVGRLKAVIR